MDEYKGKRGNALVTGRVSMARATVDDEWPQELASTLHAYLSLVERYMSQWPGEYEGLSCHLTAVRLNTLLSVPVPSRVVPYYSGQLERIVRPIILIQYCRTIVTELGTDARQDDISRYEHLESQLSGYVRGFGEVGMANDLRFSKTLLAYLKALIPRFEVTIRDSESIPDPMYFSTPWQVFTDVVFCVSSYEAIWGSRAFSDSMRETLGPSVLERLKTCFGMARHKGFLDERAHVLLEAAFRQASYGGV